VGGAGRWEEDEREIGVQRVEEMIHKNRLSLSTHTYMRGDRTRSVHLWYNETSIASQGSMQDFWLGDN